MVPILRSLYSTSSKNKAKIFGGENSQNAYIHIRTSLWNPFSTNDLIIVLVSLRKLGKKVSRNSLTELSSSASPSTTRAHTPANSWKIRQRDSYSKTVLSGLFYFIEQTFSPLPFPRSQNDSLPLVSLRNFLSPLFRAYEVQYTFIGLVPPGYKPLPCAPSLHRAQSIEVFR